MFEFVVDDKVVLKLLDTINADKLFELTDSDRPYLKEWLPWVDGTKRRSLVKLLLNMLLES